MSCAVCGAENPRGSLFCLGCGRALDATCRTCGVALPSSARFCNACGAALGDVRAAVPQPRDPRAYTPKHLAEQLYEEIGAPLHAARLAKILEERDHRA